LKFRPGCSTGRHALTLGIWQLNRLHRAAEIAFG
jgi:cytochrome oxidase assembly protein ShyY1